MSIDRSTPTSMTLFDWLDRADTIQHIHTIPTFRRLFIVVKMAEIFKIILKIITIIFPGNFQLLR